jgi:hypothetical protein
MGHDSDGTVTLSHPLKSSLLPSSRGKGEEAEDCATSWMDEKIEDVCEGLTWVRSRAHDDMVLGHTDNIM